MLFPEKKSILKTGATLAMLLSASFLIVQNADAKPFELGIEQKQLLPGDSQYQGEAGYPAPQALPNPYQSGGVQQNGPIQGGIRARPKAPLKANINRSIPLPKSFLGTWKVRGRLQQSQGSAPKYQEALPRIFRPNTENIWKLNGNPKKGYFFSNKRGAKSPLYVNKVEGNTAFIRYGHPVGNCVAQEAIVMQLSGDGMEFKGLESVNIVKKGERWRFKAKYQLVGVRQR